MLRKVDSHDGHRTNRQQDITQPTGVNHHDSALEAWHY
jgi:hypothetical protein